MLTYLGLPSSFAGFHDPKFRVVLFLVIKGFSQRSTESTEHSRLLRLLGGGIGGGPSSVITDSIVISIIGDALITTPATRTAKRTIVAVFFLVRGHLVEGQYCKKKWVGRVVMFGNRRRSKIDPV